MPDLRITTTAGAEMVLPEAAVKSFEASLRGELLKPDSAGYASKLPSRHCEVFIGLIGGQASRIAPDETAYSHRDAKFVLNVHGRWERAEEDQRCISWARDFFNAAAPHATSGVYVNFLTQEELDRIPAAYRPEVWKRLVEVKTKWDPKNLFRMNQNIQPTV